MGSVLSVGLGRAARRLTAAPTTTPPPAGRTRLSVRVLNVTAMGATGRSAELRRLEPAPRPGTVAAPDHLRRGGPETTGGRATGTEQAARAITEIGAVKVRGGAVLGEFATLVDPQRSIPPQIVQLTGITTAMVCDAPTIDAVLPMFLELARGSVLVAHNAGFDIGFLRAAAQRCESPGPGRQCCARSGWPAGAEPRGSPQRAAGRAGAAVRRRHPAHPPRPRRRPGHRGSTAPLIEPDGNRARTPTPTCAPNCPTRRRLSAAMGCSPNPRAGPGLLFRGTSGEALYVGTAIDLRPGDPAFQRPNRGRTRRWSGWPPRSTTSSARTGWRPASGSCGCWPHSPAVQPPVEVSAALVVGGLTDEAFPRFSVCVAAARPRRRPVPVPRRRRRHRGAAGAVHRVRTCTTRLARSALHGPACPSRGVACPAAREHGHPVRRGGGARRGPDRRPGQLRAGRGRAPGHRARRAPPL